MAENKSSVYGYYGGVTEENHYVPPASQEFIPQPPQVAFTEADRELVQQLVDQTKFYAENAPDILLRTLASRIPNSGDNIDTFVLSTSANPEDTIVYTSDVNDVNLNRIDGGFF